MEVHQVIKIILIAICSKFFKDSRLHFFQFSPKIWLTGKKKSYIVFSFYLNLMDYPKQTVTTPSTQLEKAQRMTNRQREKRRGKRKTRPKVKPSQKSKTE